MRVRILTMVGALWLSTMFMSSAGGFLGNAHAQEGPLALNMTGHLVVMEMVDGEATPRLDPLPEEVMPDDVVQYDITGKNVSGQVLRRVAAGGKIPGGTAYIEGSARCDAPAEIQFSIDNGQSFAEPPLKVEVELADGTKIKRTVPTDRYTDIRFRVMELGAGETFVGSYGVMVR